MIPHIFNDRSEYERRVIKDDTKARNKVVTYFRGSSNIDDVIVPDYCSYLIILIFFHLIVRVNYI